MNNPCCCLLRIVLSLASVSYALIASRPRCFGVFFVPVDDGSIERPNIFIWGMLEMYLIFFFNWSSCPAGSPRAGSDFEKAREVGAGI